MIVTILAGIGIIALAGLAAIALATFIAWRDEQDWLD